MGETGYMGIQLLLKQIGLGRFAKTGNGNARRMSQGTQERLRFEEDVREQFRELKRKGLGIPVFTL